MTLARGNPNGTEYAQHTLNMISLLQGQGWSVSGLWMPAYCGIPGNKRADTLAKLGSQSATLCQHTRVTRTWLQAQVRQRLMVEWTDQFS